MGVLDSTQTKNLPQVLPNVADMVRGYCESTKSEVSFSVAELAKVTALVHVGAFNVFKHARFGGL